MWLYSIVYGKQPSFYDTNGMSDMIGCLQVVGICSFMKEIKLYLCDIVFLFVKLENR